MKITSVSTALISVPLATHWSYGLGVTSRRDELIVFIDTDDGIRGIGASHHGHAGRTIKAAIDFEITPLLLGRDPLEIQNVWDYVFGSLFHLGSVTAMAMSGVDTALWDIMGKVSDMPLYKILGGGGTTALPAYVGCMTLGIQSPESLVQEATGFSDLGFQALKLRGGAGVERDVEAVAAVRNALPEVDIMVDANCAYSWGDAVLLGRRLAEFNVTWLEDPFDYAVVNHHRQMGQLAQVSETPIASGASIFTRFDLQSLLDAGGCQYITPDVVKCGGISEAMKMAAMASSAGLLVATHTIAGLAGVANAHFTASIPANARSYIEWDPSPSALQDDLLTPSISHRNGMIHLPEGPGLGVQINDEVLAQHPYIPERVIASGTRGEAARLLSQYPDG